MQQHPSAVGHLVPRLWRAFHLASALSLVLCVGAFTAQVTGSGVPIFAVTVGSYARPPEYLYGVTWGDHYFTFTGIFLVTVWLPFLWLVITCVWTLHRIFRRGRPAV